MSGIVAYLCISPVLGGGDGQLAPHERGLKLNYVLYMHSQIHMYPPKHKHTHTCTNSNTPTEVPKKYCH